MHYYLSRDWPIRYALFLSYILKGFFNNQAIKTDISFMIVLWSEKVKKERDYPNSN